MLKQMRDGLSREMVKAHEEACAFPGLRDDLLQWVDKQEPKHAALTFAIDQLESSPWRSIETDGLPDERFPMTLNYAEYNAIVLPLQSRIAELEAEVRQDCDNCWKCLEGVVCDLGIPVTGSRMILCPICGNKRCPKASDHKLACTNSNESGQRGSVYSAVKEKE